MPFLLSRIERIRNATQQRLHDMTPQTGDFYVLIGLSSALATLGLLMNNIAVVIGAMVVAPLVTPLFAFSLSLLIFQIRDLGRSFLAILMGTILAIGMSALVGWGGFFVAGNWETLTSEILSRSEPNMFFFLVALFSGMAGSFAYAKPKILESVTGIAISVAIIPPLAVSGIGIALNDMFLFKQSFLLYTFNVIGICLGSILMFIFLGFGKKIENAKPVKKK